MKDFFKTVSDSIDPELSKGLAISLCIVILFTAGFTVGNLSSMEIPVEGATESGTTQSSTVPSTAGTTAPTVPSTAPTEESTAAPDTSEEADKPSAPASEGSEEMSVSEILNLYNDSANKVKTDAVKVVKNFEDREMQEDKLDVPGVLESLANSLIPKFMGDDTEPVEYATKEDIVANFMVPGQSYVSALTEADISEATCTDNGTEYEIMIKVKDETNPSPGKGVGSAFDVIETSEVTSSEVGSMVEKFDTHYYDCVIKCKIDKSSGNMTWASYKTPLVLEVVVNMFGTHNASVGLSFEKDYNIFY